MPNKSPSLKTKIKQIPHKPGIYLFKNGQGDVIYIGKARSLQERVRSYFLPSNDQKIRHIARETSDFEYILTESPREAAFLENNFIRRYQPKFNLRLKDDKHFPFIKITADDPYPRICLARRVEDDGSKYFGPFSPSLEARKTITLISRHFGIRTCMEKIPGRRKRPCLEHDLGLCSAPCVDLISQSDYRENVDNALLFLRGNTGEVIRNIKEKMTRAAENHKFENAAHWRDLIETLEHIKNKPQLISTGKENMDIFGFSREEEDIALCIFIMRQGEVRHSEQTLLNASSRRMNPMILSAQIRNFYSTRADFPDQILMPFSPGDLVSLQEKVSSSAGKKITFLVPRKGKKKKLVDFASTNAETLLKKSKSESIPLMELRVLFGLKDPPRLIEGFDISNTGGAESVGSLVVFENGKPSNNKYRIFRIKSVSGSNDIASLEEVITRRYRRLQEENQELPGLIIVDGGKGQWNAARKALASLGLAHIPSVSIAKKEDIVFSACHPHGIKLKRNSPALQLIQHIRDETHRFAITHHRKRREKMSFQSLLDGIPSIGPKRKSVLLTHFNSIQEILKAPQSEIKALIGAEAAKSLKNFFCRNDS